MTDKFDKNGPVTRRKGNVMSIEKYFIIHFPIYTINFINLHYSVLVVESYINFIIILNHLMLD